MEVQVPQFVNLRTRFVAYLVDNTVCIVVSLLIGYLIGVLFGLFPAMQTKYGSTYDFIVQTNYYVLLGLSTICWCLYLVLCFSSRLQGTLGCAAVSIKIVNRNFERLNIRHSLILCLAYLVLYATCTWLSISDLKSYLPLLIVLLVYLSVYLPVIFTKEKTSLIDIICKTRFVKKVDESLLFQGKVFAGAFRRLLILLIDLGVCILFINLSERVISLDMKAETIFFIILYAINSILLPLTPLKGTIGMKILGCKIDGLKSVCGSLLRFIFSGIYMLPIIMYWMINIFSVDFTNVDVSDAKKMIALSHSMAAGYLFTTIVLWGIANICAIAFTRESTAINDSMTNTRVVRNYRKKQI